MIQRLVCLFRKHRWGRWSWNGEERRQCGRCARYEVSAYGEWKHIGWGER